MYDEFYQDLEMNKSTIKLAYKEAEYDKRFISLIIDATIYVIFIMIITFIFKNYQDLWLRLPSTKWQMIIFGLAIIDVLYFISYYYLLVFILKGRTVGKLLTNTKIISVYGTEAKNKDIIRRHLMYVAYPVLMILPLIGNVYNWLLLVAFIESSVLISSKKRKTHQALHDYFGKTVVIDVDATERLRKQLESKLQS